MEEEKEKKLAFNQKRFDNTQDVMLSAKMERLLKELREMGVEDKAIVYSQFTSFLNLVAMMLEQQGILYARLDGTMSQQKRAEAINNFKTNPKVPLFLISLKAGGVGLNLTEANRLWLLDPWW